MDGEVVDARERRWGLPGFEAGGIYGEGDCSNESSRKENNGIKVGSLVPRLLSPGRSSEGHVSSR